MRPERHTTTLKERVGSETSGTNETQTDLKDGTLDPYFTYFELSGSHI